MATSPSLLIVDDEEIKTVVLQDSLTEAGYEVDLAHNAQTALRFLQDRRYDVILTDIRMPGMDGLSFLRQVREQHPEQAFLVMTAFASVDAAVQAMKLGAFDFMQKPFSSEELILKLDRLINFNGLRQENRTLKQRLALSRQEPELIGQSPAIRQVLDKIHMVAANDSTVLIEGESGTGKNIVAQLIHESSQRANGEFLTVSCASLPDTLIEAELFGHEAGAFTGAAKQRQGRFEVASGGTLFLDDVDDVPMPMQVKLLRALQERRIERVGSATPIAIDIRLIAASKLDLRKLVMEGNFREDLYYRLNVIPIYLPPLRERREDIPLLATHFLNRHASRQGRDTPTLTREALEVISSYTWPGNVRELEHYTEQLMALSSGDILDVDDLPSLRPLRENADPLELNLEHQTQVDLQDVLAQTEARIVEWALRKSVGNLAHAAELLMIPRSTLQYRLTKLEKAGYPMPYQGGLGPPNES